MGNKRLKRYKRNKLSKAMRLVARKKASQTASQCSSSVVVSEIPEVASQTGLHCSRVVSDIPEAEESSEDIFNRLLKEYR